MKKTRDEREQTQGQKLRYLEQPEIEIEKKKKKIRTITGKENTETNKPGAQNQGESILILPPHGMFELSHTSVSELSPEQSSPLLAAGGSSHALVRDRAPLTRQVTLHALQLPHSPQLPFTGVS